MEEGDLPRMGSGAWQSRACQTHQIPVQLWPGKELCNYYLHTLQAPVQDGGSGGEKNKKFLHGQPYLDRAVRPLKPMISRARVVQTGSLGNVYKWGPNIIDGQQAEQ